MSTELSAQEQPAEGMVEVLLNKPRAMRGFAAMDKDRQRQIASAGGRAAHECGNAHEFTSEEARMAGKKGGKAISENRGHMATIGSVGGTNRWRRVRADRSKAS